MKVIGSILVMIASCGIGFLYAGELVRRKKELEEQYNLMKLILGDVRYMRATLLEAVNRAIRIHKGSYLEFLEEISACLTDAPGIALSDIWKNAVEKALCRSALNNEDKQNIILLGENLSGAERENVIACFEEYLDGLKIRIAESGNCLPTKTRLYRSLGVLAGAFIVVLFM